MKSNHHLRRHSSLQTTKAPLGAHQLRWTIIGTRKGGSQCL